VKKGQTRAVLVKKTGQIGVESSLSHLAEISDRCSPVGSHMGKCGYGGEKLIPKRHNNEEFIRAPIGIAGPLGGGGGDP